MLHVKISLPAEFKPIEQNIPISLQCIFCFPVPKSASKKTKELMLKNELKHTKRPDTDNCLKFVKDCLNSLVWHDDSQVYKVEACKEYSEHPHTLIIIEVTK